MSIPRRLAPCHCAGWPLLVATGPGAPCRGRGLSGAHSAARSIESKQDWNRASGVPAPLGPPSHAPVSHCGTRWLRPWTPGSGWGLHTPGQRLGRLYEGCPPEPWATSAEWASEAGGGEGAKPASLRLLPGTHGAPRSSLPFLPQTIPTCGRGRLPSLCTPASLWAS